MNLEAKIHYLKEAIQFQTAMDIVDLPRPEFAAEVARCSPYVVKAAIPHVVLFILEEQHNSFFNKFKLFFTGVK